MIKTPYLKPFNTQGGTLYVFPSVSRDLTKTFVSNDYEFRFGHFACLNIPDICRGTYSDGSDSDEIDKGLYIETLRRASQNTSAINWSDKESIGKAIIENLQNYVMNFETAILNGEGDNDDYDPDVLTTVSEKVFWNWMQKVGAIKFNESGTAEDTSGITDISEIIKNRTVKYIGNIDVMNTVEINGDAFEELYIHIPSSVGASTSVYFRTGEMTDEKNYLNKNYTIGDNEIIIGRREDASPYGLSKEAILDTDEGGNIYKGDIGHTIDFRDSSYDGGQGINNMNGKSLEDFEFNAILIYYDIYEKTNNPGVKRVATNLYGILFLEEVSIENGGIFIQRYPKKRETVYGNGNSYALKLDLKVNTFSDMDNTIDVEPSVEDHITSMSLYIKALEKLQKCIDIFYTQKQQIVNLSERISILENLVMGIDSISYLKEEIQRLNNLCNENAIVDTATLLGLIDNNSKRLDNIMTGGKDLKIQFDTDVLQAGAGIGLQKSQNKVVINSEQRYSINTVYDDDNEVIDSGSRVDYTDVGNCTFRIPLMPGENFAVIYLNDNGNNITDSLRIDIDTDTNSWKIGQSLKILFDCDGHSLVFDDNDVIGISINPADETETIEILSTDFEGKNLIEIICIGVDSNDKKIFKYLIK